MAITRKKISNRWLMRILLSYQFLIPGLSRNFMNPIFFIPGLISDLLQVLEIPAFAGMRSGGAELREIPAFA
jgi:hypothetical protein